MIEIISGARPSLALDLKPHDGQKNQAPLTCANLFSLIASGPAWHVKIAGKTVAIGGHTPVWEGRTIVWGYLGADCGPALPVMTKEVRRQIAALAVEFPRIEAYVERNHAPGHRWIKLLGFRREGVMGKFANGKDYFLYAKVT